jgi:hypothetical protein
MQSPPSNRGILTTVISVDRCPWIVGIIRMSRSSAATRVAKSLRVGTSIVSLDLACPPLVGGAMGVGYAVVVA